MGKSSKKASKISQKDTQSPNQQQKWLLLYPLYLDKSISRNKGRQVKNRLAIPKLTVKEITSTLKELKIPFSLEEQCIHQNDPDRPGRVKYSLTDAEGDKVDEKIPNSEL